MQQVPLDHQTGAHCGSTGLVNLSRYYDWGFDEPTCFGLGTGLGFSYLQYETSPHRGIMGRTGWLERAFFERLGIGHQIHQGESVEEALASIRGEIDRGVPVMLFTDIYYLDYFDSSIHFSPHVVLAVGYDDGGVVLADSEFADRQYVPLDRLEQSITSKHSIPLQCRYLTIDDPAVSVSFASTVRQAILETVSHMLDPNAATRSSRVFPDQGVEQIEAFAADLPEWSTLPDPSWTARFAYQNVERRGTGGGAFRQLFADFLETAGSAITLPDGAPERMGEIADEWTALGELLYEASEADEQDVDPLFEEASERASWLATTERDLYQELATALGA